MDYFQYSKNAGLLKIFSLYIRHLHCTSMCEASTEQEWCWDDDALLYLFLLAACSQSHNNPEGGRRGEEHY